MLRPAPLVLSVAVLCCHSMPDAEAALNKCTDGIRITYTTDPCEKTGLNRAGPIKDAVTIMPATRIPPKGSSEKSGKAREEKEGASENKAPRNNESGADVSGESTIKLVNPLANRMPD